MSIYTDEGYESRRDYLRCLAEEYGVSVLTVYALADMLGPNEDFDGLINEIQDISEL
jgi:hypothetical protein